jgi:hypothetical protein
MLLLVCACLCVLACVRVGKGDRRRACPRSVRDPRWLGCCRGCACLDSCLGKAETGSILLNLPRVCLAPSRTDRSRQVRVDFRKPLNLPRGSCGRGATAMMGKNGVGQRSSSLSWRVRATGVKDRVPSELSSVELKVQRRARWVFRDVVDEEVQSEG